MRNRRRWRRILLGFILAAPLVAAFLAVLCKRHQYAVIADTLPAKTTEARSMGLPTEAADMLAMVRCRAEDNAAPLYVEAADLVRRARPKKDFSDELSLVGTGKATETILTRVDRQLEPLQEVFDLLREASAKPGMEWGHDWQNPIENAPKNQDLKMAVRLLCAKAQLLAHHGKYAKAWRALSSAASIGTHASVEPSLLGFLVHQSIDAAVLACAEALIRSTADPFALQRAKSFLQELPQPPSLSHAFEGEMYRCLWIARNAHKLRDRYSGTDTPLFWSLPESLLVGDPTFRRAWEVSTLEYWMKVIAAVRSTHDWRQVADEGYRLANESENDPLFSRVNAVTSPAFFNAAVSRERFRARRQLLATAVAVLQHQKRTGELPTDLARAGIEATDPFNEEPMGYRNLIRGFRLYSVEQDLKDDGGRSQSEVRKVGSQTYDLEVHFDLPNSKATAR